ncbi:MAG: M23 family metallopeptidase [Vicingus serpentipes]|nr:M23 family metallopeptidase [Vicingus serpentipes]
MRIQKQLIIFFIFLSTASFCQDSIPVNYFRSPLGIPLYLSGNFGELRSNHFHAGLDMKTQGKEGLNIHATADGFVSRVKISPWGYGNVIYIDHPNGYTTVYAHLKEFKGHIAQKIKAYQYEKESWEMDWYPPDTLMKVKKGEIIALSGNTGGSGGPHLHFEIRETISENPVNPLLFGFAIKDNIKPTIKSIAVFPLNDTSYVNGSTTVQRFPVVFSNGKYILKYGNNITAYGEIGIGIETIDKLNDVHNPNGIYSIQLTKDNEIIFLSEMEKFDFSQIRALNALIDYETYLRKNIRYQKSFVEPNNQLNIYKKEKNKGVVHFSTNKSDFQYLVKDSYGNASSLQFQISGQKPSTIPSVIRPKIDTVFHYADSNVFVSKDLNIIVGIPPNSLYKDLPFQFYTKDTLYGAITPTYYIHNDYTPLHYPISVAIKAGRLSDSLRDKAVIVHVDRNKRIYSKGGKWRKNYLKTTSKAFGGFAIMLDTKPPKITPINIFPNKHMANNSAIIVKIEDNLSGIGAYRGTIDGKWIKMEYEAKKAKLFYTFDNIPQGNHTFELTLTDGVGNSSTVSIPFIR